MRSCHAIKKNKHEKWISSQTRNSFKCLGDFLLTEIFLWLLYFLFRSWCFLQKWSFQNDKHTIFGVQMQQWGEQGWFYWFDLMSEIHRMLLVIHSDVLYYRTTPYSCSLNTSRKNGCDKLVLIVDTTPPNTTNHLFLTNPSTDLMWSETQEKIRERKETQKPNHASLGATGWQLQQSARHKVKFPVAGH